MHRKKHSKKQHKKLHKKGAIEVQFNWIFVIVVGAIILTFFVHIVLKQKELSDLKISARIINDMETIVVGAREARGTIMQVELPDTELRFQCDECDCKYYVSSMSKSFADNILFTPGIIAGVKMFSWTLDWNSPFRITNFLYLTNPRVRFIFVSSDTSSEPSKKLSDKIKKDLPREIKANFVSNEDDNAIVYRNENRIRFVFLGWEKSDMDEYIEKLGDGVRDEVVSAIFVENPGSPNLGKVTFYNVKDGKFDPDPNAPGGLVQYETYYMGYEALLAAIFSEDHEIYNCNMAKAFQRLKYVTKTYRGKIEQLIGHVTSFPAQFPNCYYLTQQLDDISLKAGTIYTEYMNPRGGAVDSTVIDRMREIQTLTEELSQTNNMLQLYSCPEIY